MTKISVFSLGCKVNSYDGDAMLAVLSNAGFEVTDELDFADVYVINTCAVTAEAERKSRQTITKVKKLNPNAEIYVCGCASQNNAKQFEKDGVIYVSGTDKKIELAHQLANKYSSINCAYFVPKCDFNISTDFEENEGVKTFHTRHFIKVQDGCNNFCSYCLIPYVRGRCRSRSIENIKSELEVAKNTAKEVVLTGINLSAYGIDNGETLTSLTLALKEYDFRIRYGSLEVRVIDDEFLQATKQLKAFCPHFHLSLQSGDDLTLKKMNRHYSTDEYYQAVQLIRKYYPDAAITTDIIVGFPTETKEQFENSMAFAKKVAFSDAHVFPYSSRKGTVAGKMPTIPSDELNERAKIGADVKAKLIKNYLEKQIGKEQEVLFETCDDGIWCGHARNYVKVYSKAGERNTIKTLKAIRLYKDGVFAE